jgi:hypothetical protein
MDKMPKSYLREEEKQGLTRDEVCLAEPVATNMAGNLDKPRLSDTEKALIDARKANMQQAVKLYAQRQAKAMMGYIDKGASLQEQAFEVAQIQECILLAARNSLEDGNAAGYLNLAHPVKGFDELKAELGKYYAGDKLWEEVIAKAQSNTQAESAGCFVAGTLVHTKEGLRPIEEIKVGDWVLSKPEDGSGGPEYRQVSKTLEFDDKPLWYVEWEDPGLHGRCGRDGDLSISEVLGLEGRCFVITTPNHPFWVEESDPRRMWLEDFKYCDPDDPNTPRPPWPQRQWARADHLVRGMKMLKADGGQVEVLASRRVYKTGDPAQGWIDRDDQDYGLGVNFADLDDQPLGALNARYKPSGHGGYVLNPDKSWLDDVDPYLGSAPESWCRRKVYNLEVEGCHTYFVDTLGVWVHNDDCGAE